MGRQVFSERNGQIFFLRNYPMVKSCFEIFCGILRKPSVLTLTYKLKLDQKTFYFEHQKNNSKTVTV